MKFKEFRQLTEDDNVEVGQAEDFHEPTGTFSSSLSNPRTRSQLNYFLVNHLKDRFRAPEVAMETIYKSLGQFGVHIPSTYVPDQEADELAIDLKQYDQETPYKLYLIYDLENGYYNFHAEVADEDRIADLLLDEGEGEEL